MNRALIYILALFCLTSCIKEKPTGTDLVVGDRIPDFEVTMNDGTLVTGALLREGVSVVVFFTTQCQDCRETLPQVQSLYEEYAEKGVRFTLISREDTDVNISVFWNENRFTMPYSAQSDRSIYELFARTRVPRIYVCRNGEIKQIFTDQPSNPTYDVLKAALDGALYKY